MTDKFYSRAIVDGRTLGSNAGTAKALAHMLHAIGRGANRQGYALDLEGAAVTMEPHEGPWANLGESMLTITIPTQRGL